MSDSDEEMEMPVVQRMSRVPSKKSINEVRPPILSPRSMQQVADSTNPQARRLVSPRIKSERPPKTQPNRNITPLDQDAEVCP